MRRLILGTAGHIDHGKTALVRALTGVDTDRLPDEKRRGITIDLGFASLQHGDTTFGIVDVPGHEAFVRNMLAGATGIDVGLLVVAADEGVMPQTREHLAILDLLAVPALVVALTKCDLADSDWLELVTADVRDTLAHTSYASAAIVPVSAREGRGLDELIGALDAAANSAAARPVADLFRMPVDRAFTVHGTGTVTTGTIWSGTVAREETLRLLPGGTAARVRGLQSHGTKQDRLIAGQRAALALVGLDRANVSRGATLVREGGWRESGLITARVRLLPDAAPLLTRRRIRFHLGTAEILGRAVLLDRETLAPGDEGWVQLRLESTVVARAGDRFVLRDYSPVHTIGGGRIVEPVAPRRRRLDPELAERLVRVLGPDPDTALDTAVRLAGVAGLPVEELSVRAAVTLPAAAAWLDSGAALRAGPLVVHAAAVDRVARALVQTLTHHHEQEPLLPGLDLQLLRQAAPRGTAAPVLDLALGTLTHSGEVAVEGSQVRLAAHAPSPTAAQAAEIDRVAAAIREAGLAAVAPAELPPALAGLRELRRYLGWLEREGRVVGIPGDRWLDAEVLAEATVRIRRELGDRNDLSAADFRDALPVSRKYLIPILEHLDRTGVTRRTGDLRQVVRG